MSEALDGAIDSPDRDLLGMRLYAEQLAELIKAQPPPFTVGIYGEWGTGKTSFVQLVSHYLGDQVTFIAFSAWQYKTADEIWRALLLEIARKLYGVEPVAKLRPAAGDLQRLGRALTQDALVLREATGDERKENQRKFDELAARLGMFTERIGHPTTASRLDPEAVGVAIAKASVVAAGAFAPWLGRLKDLLGFDAKLKPEQLLRAGELTPDRVASTREFLRTFKDLVETRAAAGVVCVFVDDLDRCMPDTALDVLEAIKLYLGDAPCMFIVAADQQLIAHGLQLRLRGAGADKDDAAALHAKGREYFEKIIQLGIPVPHRTYDDVHALVSARCPEWVSATDTIHAVVGGNPRRVKQYCAWLSYRHAVVRAYQAALQSSKTAEPGASLRLARPPASCEPFLKLVALRAWHRDCASAVRQVAEPAPSGAAPPAAAYGAVIAAVQDALVKRATGLEDKSLRARATALARARSRKRADDVLGPEQRKQAVAALDAERRTELTDPRARQLYDFAVESAPVHQLFSDPSSPLLSLPAAELATLFRLASVRPARGAAAADRDRMLTSEDAAFDRIANAGPDASKARELLIDDLARWMSLLDRDAVLAAAIAGLATRASDPARPVSDSRWNDQLLLIEAGLVSRRKPDSSQLCPEAQALWEVLRGETATQEFLDPGRPRFSTLLRQEVEAFAMLEPDQLPEVPGQDSWSDQAALRARAAAAIQASVRDWPAPAGFAAAVNAAAAGLQLRIEIADQLVVRRTFAKLDALSRAWPELGQLVRADRTAINERERGALASKDDDPVSRLLRLRPRFGEIPDALIAQYFQMARELVVSSAAPAAPAERPPASARPASEQPATGEPAVAATRPATGEPAVAGARPISAERPARIEPGIRYENVTVEIVPFEGTSDYRITLTHGGSSTPPVSASIDREDIERRVKELKRAMLTYVGRDIRDDRGPDRRGLLESIGIWTYQQMFPGALGEQLRALLKGGRNLRIAWRWHAALAFLPWETLRVPSAGPFLGLDRRLSLVRNHPAGVSGATHALRTPLRMLVVMTSPRNAPPLNIEREEAMLRDTVGSDPRVQLELLTDGTADKPTFENTLKRLEDFEPHVFHLVAHGFHPPGSERGALLLSKPDGDGDVVMSERIAPLFGRTGPGRTSVQLAVLNSCDTGRSQFGDAVAGIAGDMVAAGLPVAIATTREVLDPAAVLFAREFYRAYLDGHPLEASLTEARLALNANDWDWSAYTLLTSLDDLDAFTLGPPLARRDVQAPEERSDDRFRISR